MSQYIIHTDEDVDIIDCTSANNEPDYLSVKMSSIDNHDNSTTTNQDSLPHI